MNFAHIVGEHSPTTQAESIVHTLLSWAPLVLSIIIVCTTVYVITKRRTQPERVKARSHHDNRL